MTRIKRAPSRGLSLRNANSLDARAAAGSSQARRRRTALVSVAGERGLPAKSATSAAIMLQSNQDVRTALRVDIAEVRDAITEDQWPVEVAVTNADGEEVLVTLTNKEEGEALLQALETRLQTMSDTGQQLQLQLQDAMNKQQQAMQILSNIMKNQHDTLKAIIQNMRA